MLSDATDASSGSNLYTPESGKLFELKHLIISWTGAANASMQIYDATSGTTDPVFDFNFDFADTKGGDNINHIGPLDGFYFGHAFRVVATANNVNVAASGILW
jgi:hypothetical protein|tara:strand:- start:180 stop:488 length:309 start_codon:yes stop_codon:yes gene_type:complete